MSVAHPTLFNQFLSPFNKPYHISPNNDTNASITAAPWTIGRIGGVFEKSKLISLYHIIQISNSRHAISNAANEIVRRVSVESIPGCIIPLCMAIVNGYIIRNPMIVVFGIVID